MSDFDFDFSEDDAKQADRASNKLENGAYELLIKRVQLIENSTGSKSIEFTVNVENEKGPEISSSFLWESDKGEPAWGAPIVKAAAYLLGVKPEPKPGKVMVWEDKKKVEADGTVFPAFHGKVIGGVLQKTINENGKGFFGIAQFFDWKTKLTASEKKEGATKAEKLAVTLKNLKTIDKSKKEGAGKRPDIFNEGSESTDDDPI